MARCARTDEREQRSEEDELANQVATSLNRRGSGTIKAGGSHAILRPVGLCGHSDRGR